MQPLDITTKKKIKELKEVLNSGADPIVSLDSAFYGRSALIISGGPSAVQWEEILDQEKENKPIVVCVKETIELTKDLCDIHFVNSANLIKYKDHYGALTIMTNNAPTLPRYDSYDVNFEIMFKNHGNSNLLLAKHNHFECFTLEKSGIYRPTGPGVMHESVIYTLVHLGIKRIATIGWDVADQSGTNVHFNDKQLTNFMQGNIEINDRIRMLRMLKLLFSNSIYIKKYFFKVFRFLPYHFGRRINIAKMQKGEAQLVSLSIIKMKEWLITRGVVLEVYGGSKWIK